MRRIATGARGPLWLRAERQAAGRGRSGRSWSSPAGNLSATLLFEPGCAIEQAHQLSLVTGVAIFDAVVATFAEAGIAAPSGLRVKWPNDLMIGDAKLSGVLIESSIIGGHLVAVIGCGLNIASVPEVTDRPVTRLVDYGLTEVGPAEFLERLSASLVAWLRCWDRGVGFAEIREAWLARAGAIGAEMTVNAGDGPIAGRFQGIDEVGALLLVNTAGKVHRFHFGDVTHTGTGAGPADGDA